MKYSFTLESDVYETVEMLHKLLTGKPYLPGLTLRNLNIEYISIDDGTGVQARVKYETVD